MLAVPRARVRGGRLWQQSGREIRRNVGLRFLWLAGGINCYCGAAGPQPLIWSRRYTHWRHSPSSRASAAKEHPHIFVNIISAFAISFSYYIPWILSLCPRILLLSLVNPDVASMKRRAMLALMAGWWVSGVDASSLKHYTLTALQHYNITTLHYSNLDHQDIGPGWARTEQREAAHIMEPKWLQLGDKFSIFHLGKKR